MANKKANSSLFSALLYIVLGVLLIVFKTQTLHWAMTIAGIVFVVSGILDIIRKNWGSGAISLIIGIVILVLGWLVTDIVLLVLGILLAIKGVIALIDALRSKKKSIIAIIFAILTIVVGLALAFGNALEILLIVCGVVLLIDGVLGLIAAIKK